jgi:twitching motility protein PilT
MISSSEGISDLLFAVGKPPVVEEHGFLEEFPIDTPTGLLDSTMIDQIAEHVMQGDERLKAELDSHGSCDCSYALADLARMRVNIFKQNGRPAIVMRKLQTAIPTLDQLGLPALFREMIKEKNGIIFVTGATGSGKTTTLAAMLNELNETQSIHILTLEDPIEFLHPHKKALFNQRQLGKDFRDFASGLRSALRQAPKVILVGEMRDSETIEIALTAAETGHLVFSTLHTIDAAKTVDRVVGAFDPGDQMAIRTRLAATFRYFISQRLIRKKEGGRLAVLEILKATMRTREYIERGETEGRSLVDAMRDGALDGMQYFDGEIEKLVREGVVSYATGLLYSTNAGNLRVLLADVSDDEESVIVR